MKVCGVFRFEWYISYNYGMYYDDIGSCAQNGDII